MCLKCCFSFNFFAKIKNWRRPKTIFGVQSWSLPHSQVRGEIVTHLVKILKLYQLVEEEASKSSLFFLSANQSPSLSSSLRSRSRGHRIRVSTWKQLDLRFSIRSKEILVKTLPKYLEKETLWNRQMLRRELRRSSLVQIENVEKLLVLY